MVSNARLARFGCSSSPRIPIDIGGEILIEIVLVVEVDDKDLIVGIARADEVEGGRIDFFALLAHRAGIVDDDAHCDRYILVAKGSNGLRAAVLENGKCGLFEVGHHTLLVIDHGGMQHHFFDLLPENEDAVIAGIGRLT